MAHLEDPVPKKNCVTQTENASPTAKNLGQTEMAGHVEAATKDSCAHGTGYVVKLVFLYYIEMLKISG